ncbi:MAG: bifunctional 5,10-methylenetetrahydrofolate dehydrogenase/5,10-methenyltetrahydrofolate cyclohydrolase, partial [Bacteroidaceae bacterium]|nr:bifunctional 5,10-methylenetetrahydrofolate dehydrogenase/5,10-methenyltetrahydrofolate cyclohydrolase [Bacteroidaceae bacterium]
TLNKSPLVHGIMLFRPMPEHIDGEWIRHSIHPAKDVDGITDMSLGGVFTGSGIGFAPCTAQAVIEMLDYYGIELRGKKVAVVGRSLVIGKPVSMLLNDRDATVTLCHSRTAKLAEVTKEADIVVLATGRAKAYGAEYFAPHQTVIDVGINNDPATGKLCGDVDFATVAPKVSAITPVPGGLGAVTTAVLVSHVVEAAKKAAERK